MTLTTPSPGACGKYGLSHDYHNEKELYKGHDTFYALIVANRMPLERIRV